MPSNPLGADRSVATTECPRLASSCAVASPMPRAAPVIKTLCAFDIRKSPLTCKKQIEHWNVPFASPNGSLDKKALVEQTASYKMPLSCPGWQPTSATLRREFFENQNVPLFSPSRSA